RIRPYRVIDREEALALYPRDFVVRDHPTWVSSTTGRLFLGMAALQPAPFPHGELGLAETSWRPPRCCTTPGSGHARPVSRAATRSGPNVLPGLSCSVPKTSACSPCPGLAFRIASLLGSRAICGCCGVRSLDLLEGQNFHGRSHSDLFSLNACLKGQRDTIGWNQVSLRLSIGKGKSAVKSQ